VRVRGLRTPFGPLSYGIKQQGGAIAIDIDAGLALPPGGIVLREPGAGWSTGHTTVNGKPAHWHGNGELRIDTLPARIAIEPTPTPRLTHKKKRP
jgi:hypothetical protein